MSVLSYVRDTIPIFQDCFQLKHLWEDSLKVRKFYSLLTQGTEKETQGKLSSNTNNQQRFLNNQNVLKNWSASLENQVPFPTSGQKTWLCVCVCVFVHLCQCVCLCICFVFFSEPIQVQKGVLVLDGCHNKLLQIEWLKNSRN